MGRTLGAYEVLHAIKAGGMGEVLLARRRGPAGFEQLVAIKTILPSLTSHAKVRTMFLDEARLLARLSHPAIANVHDFGDQDGQLYLVMEYVPGLRFRELTTLRPPPAVAARAVAEACRGLHAAHELRDLHGAPLGVVHRDLSPENLMLGHDGRVKVLDFGIALVKGRDTVTEHGTIKGKPPYMSPEQVRNRPLDRRSDVFSAALVLHELLTGEPVFGGDSLYGVARAVMDDPIAPPSAKAGPLPAGLDDAVMAALVREPDGRTPSAAAFADELERVASQIGGESLEAWAERTLVRERELHRQWLAAILAGDGDSKRIGRASGVLTAGMPGAAGGAAAGA
ncbi:MAG: serine/threonine protein kinase, partial [Myxococcales bacterium]|nr:serine/threonine protein kinase [Myxococcales bacterium]